MGVSGGKIESGEPPKAALKREVMGELEADVEVGDYLGTAEYDYPSFHLSMACFICNGTTVDKAEKPHGLGICG